MNRPMRFYLLFVLIIMALGSMVSRCEAADIHKVYLGTAWTHLSNFDAGPGYNDEQEDSVDHFGIDIEYQYHMDNSYLFTSFGVGTSRVRTEDYTGWSCGGCSFPTSIRFGYKVRIN